MTGTNTPSSQQSRHDSIVEMLSTPPGVVSQDNPHTAANVHFDASTRDPTGSVRKVEEERVPADDDPADLSLSKEAVPSSTSTFIKVADSIHGHTRTASFEGDIGDSIQKVHAQEWQHIKIIEVIEPKKMVFIEGNASVEEAFNTLVRYHLNSIPVESQPGDMNCLTFDYNDLNAYLLLVLNKIKVSNKKVTEDCQNGKPVPVGEIVKLTPKNPFYKIPGDESLSTVMSILGSGVHRVAVTNSEGTKIRGILSQRRLIKWLWDNARSFPSLEPLLNSSLQELGIGMMLGPENNISNNNNVDIANTKDTMDPTYLRFRQSRVISINGEEPLIMALYKMFVERISSIAVVDNQYNLIGNISVTDVRHVTRTSQYPLLHKTCRHFISIILNSRGLENGKDSFPIFHVYPQSSLARTLAKLVATKSHRLWIVQPPETGTDSHTPGATTSGANSKRTSISSVSSSILAATERDSESQLSVGSDTPSGSAAPAIPPAAPSLFEKEYRSGKLIGVVSLTDILNIFATKQTEYKQVDPQSARRERGSIL